MTDTLTLDALLAACVGDSNNVYQPSRIWYANGYRIATDGHICVRVPDADHANDAGDDTPDITVLRWHTRNETPIVLAEWRMPGLARFGFPIEFAPGHYFGGQYISLMILHGGVMHLALNSNRSAYVALPQGAEAMLASIDPASVSTSAKLVKR